MFLSQRNGGVYYLWYTDLAGQRRKVSTRTKKKNEALAFVRKHEVSIVDKPVKSLSEFIEEFHTQSKTIHAPKTVESYRGVYRMFVDYVGDLDIAKITTKHVDGFLSKKLSETTSDTVRRCRSALSSLFETARKWGYIHKNPVRESIKPRLGKRLPLYLSPGEIRRLLSVVDDSDMRDAICVALWTGMRSAELRNLTFKQIDFRRKLICVQNTSAFTIKTKRERTIPMHPEVVGLLKRRKKKATCELVFHNNGKRLEHWHLSIPFKKYIKKARLNMNLKFHSLRATFASQLVEQGVSLLVVQKLLGHSDYSTTQAAYAHLSDAGLRKGIDRLLIIE